MVKNDWKILGSYIVNYNLHFAYALK